jgi:hypothetical protein
VCGKLLLKAVENKGKILPKGSVGVESRNGLEAAVRLLLVPALLGTFFVCSRASTGQKSTPEQPDISRSGRDFLEVCSTVDSEGNRDAARTDRKGNGDAARVYRDATCLGWVEGFADGFLVHEGLRAPWSEHDPNRSGD